MNSATRKEKTLMNVRRKQRGLSPRVLAQLKNLLQHLNVFRKVKEHQVNAEFYVANVTWLT